MACVCVTNQQHTQASRPAHRRRRQADPCATVGSRRHTALARCGRTSACSDRRTRPRDSTGATVNSGSTATANPTALRCAIAEIACRYLLAERPGAAIGRHLCACCKPGGDALVRPGLPHKSPGAPGTYRGAAGRRAVTPERAARRHGPALSERRGRSSPKTAANTLRCYSSARVTSSLR